MKTAALAPATSGLDLSKIRVADAYAAIAFLAGLFFLFVTPPFGSADETAHFERAFEVATGAYTGADGVTPGMQAVMDDAFGKVVAGEAFNAADFERLAAVDLGAGETTPWPKPLRRVMRLHSPACYLHLAPVMVAGTALSLPPLTIFYLGRLAALLAGVFLVRAAINAAPKSFRPPLVFIGLLPTTIVFFAAFNIDSLLIGLGFYFFARIAALGESGARLTRRDIAELAAIAFMLGQFKTGYLLLPALALVLPSTQFGGLKARALALALIILPGMAASLSWAMIVKTQMLGDVVYSTMNGNHVEPAAQLRLILENPLDYAATVIRTFTQSNAPALAWLSFIGLGGWTNIALSPFVYAALSFGLLLVWLSGDKPKGPLGAPVGIALQLTLAAGTALAILTLVYLQWNGVGHEVIDGFQGRYFTAFAPLLLAAAPARLSMVSKGARREILAFGAPVAGLTAMASAVIAQYY